MTTLHATRGMNFWSRRPVTRLDLVVGAYDDISSADVPWFIDRLMHAMPGLIEHRCSIGERGGFLVRLRRGTYAPHIVEHVALELQVMIGHDVGYGRTRGGDVPGEYTLVFEHLHEQVGLRAAALALETVQRAFAGTLESVDTAVTELRGLAGTPDTPPITQEVLCAVTGGSARAETVAAMEPCASRGAIVDVSPAFVLQAGLPYARSRLAIVLDTSIADVPERYREPEHARRLLSTVADAVVDEGFVICPASEWEVQDYARERGCRVGIFAVDDDVRRKDLKVASAVARVRDDRILLEHCGHHRDGGALRADAPAAAQVASALAQYLLTHQCDE